MATNKRAFTIYWNLENCSLDEFANADEFTGLSSDPFTTYIDGQKLKWQLGINRNDKQSLKKNAASMNRNDIQLKNAASMSVFIFLEPSIAKFAAFGSIGIVDSQGNLLNNMTFSKGPDSSSITYNYVFGNWTKHDILFKKQTTGVTLQIVLSLHIFNVVKAEEMIVPQKNSDGTEILACSYENLLLTTNFSDIQFITQSPVEQNGVKNWDVTKSHKCILSARCPAIIQMLENEQLEIAEDKVTIKEINTKTFRRLLQYIYSGRVDNVEESAFDLFKAAQKFGIIELSTITRSSLLKQINSENAVKFLILANDCRDQMLFNRCMEFIIINFDVVSVSEDYLSLSNNEIFSQITSAVKTTIVLKPLNMLDPK